MVSKVLLSIVEFLRNDRRTNLFMLSGTSSMQSQAQVILSVHIQSDIISRRIFIRTYTTNINLVFALDKEKANTRNLSIHFDDGFGDWDHKVLTIA